MKPPELLVLLQEFWRDKATERARHEAAATRVAEYDANNTYQYILAREESQLGWVRRAVEEKGGALAPPLPAAGLLLPPPADDSRQVASEDARLAGAFVERWRDRVDTLTHARHKKMLGIILGEALEHQRLFEQAAGGRSDLLGRGTATGHAGRVLPARWSE